MPTFQIDISIVNETDNPCCCGSGGGGCGCDDLTTLLNVGFKWTSAALPPATGDGCFTEVYPLLLQKQVGEPPDNPCILGATGHWWRGFATDSCGNPSDFFVDFACCDGPTPVYHVRIDEGQWRQMDDFCDVGYWKEGTFDELSDNGCTGPNQSPAAAVIYIWQDGLSPPSEFSCP